MNLYEKFEELITKHKTEVLDNSEWCKVFFRKAGLREDNLETRLAYNKPEEQINPSVPDSGNGAVFKITEPSPLPTELYSEPIIFKAGLYFVDTLDPNTEISIECDLDVNTDPLKYFDFEKIDGNSFMLRRKKIINRNLRVKVYIEAAQSPSGEEMSQEFELFLGGLE